jgi:hypothetical protein
MQQKKWIRNIEKNSEGTSNVAQQRLHKMPAADATQALRQVAQRSVS